MHISKTQKNIKLPDELSCYCAICKNKLKAIAYWDYELECYIYVNENHENIICNNCIDAT